MPLDDREWFRTYRQWNSKRRRFARIGRRTLGGLTTRILRLVFAAVLLAYTAAAFVHLTNGMGFRTSLWAAFQDARLAVTCPADPRRQWEFIDRSKTDQISLGRSLELGERVYRDICLADQFPLQRWSNDRPSALLSKLDATGDAARVATARPGAADPSRTVRPSRSPSNTPAPADEAPASAASIELADLKNHMLELINGDRQANGLDLVTLGDNPAAQEHAEEMLANGYLSHWGMGGMKPYMRYTLAGGVNYEGENASGVITSSWLDVFARAIFPEEQLQETQQGFMESPGHRRNIVDPLHKKVNLGISCNRTTCAVVQQFAGEYVKFSEKPAIVDGVLVMAGQLDKTYSLNRIQVWYDSPPHPLELGQLDKTYCYDLGTPAALLREPAPPGTFYPPGLERFTWEKCLNPYDVPPKPRGSNQGLKLRGVLLSDHPMCLGSRRVHGWCLAVRSVRKPA